MAATTQVRLLVRTIFHAARFFMQKVGRDKRAVSSSLRARAQRARRARPQANRDQRSQRASEGVSKAIPFERCPRCSQRAGVVASARGRASILHWRSSVQLGDARLAMNKFHMQ